MNVVSAKGPVAGLPTEYAEGTPCAGNSCGIDGIANPDNISYSPGTGVLLIGEDTGEGHQNDAVWAYDVATGDLTRIMSTPYGSETTSVYWHGDVNGHTYITGVIQHPFGESDEDKLEAAEEGRAYVGYMGPFPSTGMLGQ